MKLNIYYANWSMNSKPFQMQQVRDLPWDRLSTINHSFWRINPSEDGTKFPIGSIDENADFGTGNCFDQYEEMGSLFPDVDIVLAIGGWADSQHFSLMAATKEGRASFIESCLEFLVKYPFFTGIDIDWEYPGPSRNHDGFSGSSDDYDNFTALMREMRLAFDEAGMNDRIITYCAPTSTQMMKSGQVYIDFAAIDPYVDRVNIMTYDMAGGWSDTVMHHSALFPGRGVAPGISASESVEYLLSLGVPAHKINIGSPLYSHGWIVDAENGEAALGQPVAGGARGNTNPGNFSWYEIALMETKPGWEVLYDEESEAAYMFNIDPSSFFYRNFYTYESPRSLQAKLDYINEMGLGGLIVWKSSGDDIAGGYPMLTQMATGLGLLRDE
ncbi:MAG: hypothetical protein LBC96_08630 [Lachnospiraceae bacterium]|nr:hypothetical protein [Lachnospiraceae bacterium]